MKNIILILLFMFTTISAQWNIKWKSNSISYVAASGFFNFKKNGDTWEKRFYIVDSLKFQIMQSTYSNIPQYTYNFTSEERAAGCQIYSIGVDLTGDFINEFYVLSYIGTTSNYRQAFKVFNIVNGNVIFSMNSNNYSYVYPTFSDIDGDGYLECMVIKYDYPALDKYYYDIYETGIISSNSPEIEIEPHTFDLKQNFPNPFNPETKINFYTDKKSDIKIRIFNSTGELVKLLTNKNYEPGEHSIIWNGTSDDGRKLPSGVYLYEILDESRAITKKMLLLK